MGILFQPFNSKYYFPSKKTQSGNLCIYVCSISIICAVSVPIGMIADHHQAIWCWWCTQPFISESSWNTGLNNWTHKWTVGWIYPKSWQPLQILKHSQLVCQHEWHPLPATSQNILKPWNGFEFNAFGDE